MRKETRLLTAIDLSEQFTELVYFREDMREPVSYYPKVGETSLRIRNGALFEQMKNGGTESLRHHLQECLRIFEKAAKPSQMEVCVTLRDPKHYGDTVREALVGCGVAAETIRLIDYKESMFYYLINVRRIRGEGNVAVLDCQEEPVRCLFPDIDREREIPLARVTVLAEANLSEGILAGETISGEQKEYLLKQLLEESLSQREIETLCVIGEEISPKDSLAVKRFQKEKGRVFCGNNLFAVGACYYLITDCGLEKPKRIRYIGRENLDASVSCVVRAWGKETTVYLAKAGMPWNGKPFAMDLIPDETNTLTICEIPVFGEKQERTLVMEEFPNRPNRTVRLHVECFFSEERTCVIRAWDMGFGEIYPSEGKSWEWSFELRR